MPSAYIKGIGYYVPENVVTNKDLERHMDTSDEWIQERTGIQERRYATRHKQSTSTLGTEAAKKALANAGMQANEIDLIIFATLSPDYYFPGGGRVDAKTTRNQQYRNTGAGYPESMQWIPIWHISCKCIHQKRCL
jgi:3-oxoacyl-[acyl-carrier-protein] synthase III